MRKKDKKMSGNTSNELPTEVIETSTAAEIGTNEKDGESYPVTGSTDLSLADFGYPEHIKRDKLVNTIEYVSAHDFVQWLSDKKEIHLASLQQGRQHGATGRQLDYTTSSLSGLLAEYFGIDEKQLSAEKDAMLQAYRSQDEIAI